MPAMKPSTTSRARTSRCDSRATTSGSRNARPSLARRPPPGPAGRTGVPGRAPEAERGEEVLMPSRPPRPGQHLLVVALERRAREVALDLPARELREREQQLQLVAVHPALRGFRAVR